MDDIFNPDYWRQRTAAATHGNFHHAIYKCTAEQWARIAIRHAHILAEVVQPDWDILDAGCGWGRLLSLLPRVWKGDYLGIDLAPHFIEMAKCQYPNHTFIPADLRDVGAVLEGLEFDLCVLISIRPMIRRCAGDDIWNGIERDLRKHCSRLLFLEYDVDDNGSLE